MPRAKKLHKASNRLVMEGDELKATECGQPTRDLAEDWKDVTCKRCLRMKKEPEAAPIRAWIDESGNLHEEPA